MRRAWRKNGAGDDLSGFVEFDTEQRLWDAALKARNGRQQDGELDPKYQKLLDRSAEGEGTATQGPTESQGRQKQPTREETGLLAVADRGCPGAGVRAACRGPVTGRAREVGPAQKAQSRTAWPGLRAEERLGGGREEKCGV